MNRERLLELADHMEGLRHWPNPDPLDVPEGCFNMNRWRYICGAPACTAGHAVALWGDASNPFATDPSPTGRCRFARPGAEDSPSAFHAPVPIGILRREEDYYEAITPKEVAWVIRNSGGERRCRDDYTGAAMTTAAKICPIMSRPMPSGEIFNAGEHGNETRLINTVVFQPCMGSECALWSPVRVGTRNPDPLGHCGLARGVAPFADPAEERASQ